MRETDLWVMIHKHWPHVHATRIENTATFGTPDVNCCYKGYEWWMELKINHAGYSIIRHTQLAWIAKRIKVNGGIFIFAAEDKSKTGTLFRGKDLFNTGVLTNYTGQIKINYQMMPSIIMIGLHGNDPWVDLLDNILLCLQENKNDI